MKNTIYGGILIILGALTVPIEWDATFFFFTLILGGLAIFVKEDGGEQIESSRKKTYAEEPGKGADGHIQPDERAVGYSCTGTD